MNRRKLTKDKLVNLYFCWKKDKLTAQEIADRLDITPGTVASTKRYLNQYMSPQAAKKMKRKHTSYLRAVEEIRVKLMNEGRKAKSGNGVNHDHEVESELTKPSETVSLPTDDHYARLGQALQTFQGAVEGAIDGIVRQAVQVLVERNRTLTQKVEDLEKENKELRKANNDLLQVAEKAKNSNWVDNLRDRWNGKVVRESRQFSAR